MTEPISLIPYQHESIVDPYGLFTTNYTNSGAFISFQCITCSKIFSKSQGIQSHANSNKHKLAVERQRADDNNNTNPTNHPFISRPNQDHPPSNTTLLSSTLSQDDDPFESNDVMYPDTHSPIIIPSFEDQVLSTFQNMFNVQSANYLYFTQEVILHPMLD
jgi:hypothetical protein